MKKIITFTKSVAPYGWMGNMAGYFDGTQLTIEHDNKIWLSSENLFQALRFDDLGVQGLIRKENGFNGKKVAKKFTDDMSIKPLSRQDVLNMIYCVNLKVEQYPFIKEALINTGEDTIIEDVTFRQGGTSLFWGSAKLNQHWIGHNVLGHVWMYVRDDIQCQSGIHYSGEDDFLNYIFDRILSTEPIGKVECLNNLEFFEQGNQYVLIDRTKELSYIEDDLGNIEEFYNEPCLHESMYFNKNFIILK